MKVLSGTLVIAAAIAAVATVVSPCSALERVIATPGVGIGVAKLGMSAKKLKQVAGNFDVAYDLPSGIKVDRADWKDKGLTTMMMKVFYDKGGRAIQIASGGSSVFTTSGINKRSSLVEVMYGKNKLELTEYRAKNGRVDYYDNVAAGIAYEYRRLDGDLARKMYAIIVHKPGMPVIADADEVPLKQKRK